MKGLIAALGGVIKPWLEGYAVKSAAPADILREQLAAFIVLAIGIVISITAFFGTQHYFRLGEQQEFGRQAAHYGQTVINSLQRYEQYMLGLARSFSGPTPMDRWQFDETSQALLDRHEGLLSVAWIPRVAAARRREFEARAHDDGLFGFRIRERDQAGSLANARSRNFYFPIYYAVPFDLDREFLGMDLYTQSAFRMAFDAAGQGGHPVVLPWSHFGTSTAAATEFQIIRPVYEDSGDAESGAPQPERLRGFVAGALRLDSIVRTVVEELTTPAWLDIYVFYGRHPGDGDLLLFLPSRMRTEQTFPLEGRQIEKGLLSMQEFTIGDLALTVAVKPVAGKYSFESSILPYWVLAFGLVLTFFIAHNLAAAHSRTRIIEQTVAERTAALSNANISLHNEILERQRAEMEIRKAKDQAEVANRAKSEFLAMVSHELRTPLNAIIGFSEMMNQEVFGALGNSKYREYVGDIGKSGTHLLGLINNILDLSKVESGQFRLNEEQLHLSDGIAEVLRYVSDLAQSDGVAIETDIPVNLPPLRGDRQAIRQIFLNLLSNAIKFTERDGRVAIRAALDEVGRLVVAIEDTGIGIPEDSLESVFEPFMQVDSSLARKFEGTGLGLPLTRSLVELHNGSLKLESRIGQGTKVTVMFPPERIEGAAVH